MDCLLCQNELEEINYFSEIPATHITKQPNHEKISFANTYCKKCNLSRTLCLDNSLYIRLQSNSSLRLKEPDQHISKAAIKISTFINEKTHCFAYSYKDNALMQELKDRKLHCNEISWINDNTFINHKTEREYFISVLNNMTSSFKAPRLLILTRFFEHVFDLSDFIVKITENTPEYIYSEISNFEANNFEAYCCWNERSTYFSEGQLNRLLNSLGYVACFSNSNIILNDGFWQLWEYNPIDAYSRKTAVDNVSCQSIFQKFNQIEEKIVDKLGSIKTLNIIGAGHKGCSILSKLTKRGITCKIYDSNMSKIGSFYGTHEILNLNDLLGRTDPTCVLITVGMSAIQKLINLFSSPNFFIIS